MSEIKKINGNTLCDIEAREKIAELSLGGGGGGSMCVLTIQGFEGEYVLGGATYTEIKEAYINRLPIIGVAMIGTTVMPLTFDITENFEEGILCYIDYMTWTIFPDGTVGGALEG